MVPDTVSFGYAFDEGNILGCWILLFTGYVLIRFGFGSLVILFIACWIQWVLIWCMRFLWVHWLCLDQVIIFLFVAIFVHWFVVDHVMGNMDGGFLVYGLCVDQDLVHWLSCLLLVGSSGC